MRAVQASEEPLTFTDRAGHRVSAVLAMPASPTERVVLLLHGFLSNKNSTTNKALTRLLLEAGIATFRFDFFGQGDSQGPFERITLTIALNQALAALALVRARGFRRVGVMGSSFGGLVGVLAVGRDTEDGGHVDVLGLKCPVADFPEMLRLEFGDAGMARWKQGQEIPDITGGTHPIRLNYTLYEDCLSYDVYAAAKHILAPAMIVQGDRDEHLPLHQSQRLYQALSGPKHLEVVPGADHGFTKGTDFHFMIGKLNDWLGRYLPAH